MVVSRKFLYIKLLNKTLNNLFVVLKLLQFLLSLFFTGQLPNKAIAQEEPKPETLIKTEELKVPTSKPAKHTNNGECQKCLQIFEKFPGFHQGLKDWFIEVQKNNSEAHISAGGRGKLEQEEYFKKGSSKAHYEQSSHNFNAAIDIFKLHDTGAEWPKAWFNNVIKLAVDSHNTTADFKINWYGQPGSSFYELPHCEVSNWKELVKEGVLKLVEPT